ncbi:MAG: hypothetical protein CL603_02965 [Alteromonas sp.]|nr:hypothetical protein [Alteromonas sp.]
MSALGFNGLIAVRLFILSHFTYVKGIAFRWQRAASAFECILRGATGDGWWSAGRWFQMAKKVSMTPHDDEEEKAVNPHLIYMYIFMYNADPLYSDYIMRPRIFIGD